MGALSSRCSPPFFLWSATLTKLLIVCRTSRPACPFCFSSVMPPHSVPLESSMAASLHLILLNVVQVDVRRGHATHAQFLYEQRKVFCSNKGKNNEQTLKIRGNYILNLTHLQYILTASNKATKTQSLKRET